MSDEQLLREALELFAESLQGGRVRRLPSGGRFGPKLGGPGQVARMFRPVSADPEATAAFMAEHEGWMRAEVLNSVLHTLATWDKPPNPDGLMDQPEIDAAFVASAHLGRFLHDTPGQAPCSPVAHRLSELILAAQDHLAGIWLQPLISAKLNTTE
jgi:hypothetical protein